MHLKTKLAALGVAATMAFVAGAANATTLHFTLAGSTITNEWAFDYEVGGVDLTVTGLRCDDDKGPNHSSCRAAKIDRWSNGIGMDRGGLDSHMVDGGGRNEFLKLSFAPEIALKSIKFSYWDDNDNAFIYTHNGSMWNQVLDIHEGENFWHEHTFDTAYTGAKFLVGALKSDDQWKLKKISVTYTPPPPPNVVPLPAAGWMLLAGLGGIAAMKRRRKAA